MSVKALEKTAATFPKQRGVEFAEKLIASTGKKVSARESAWLTKHLKKQGKRYDLPARAVLENLLNAGQAKTEVASTSPTTAQKLGAKTGFTFGAKAYVGIEEQSALAYVPEAKGFVAIDDETSRVWFVPESDLKDGAKLEAVPLRPDDGKMPGLEGLCYNPDAECLLAVSEDTRKVFRMSVSFEDGAINLGEPEKIGKLPKVGKKSNKGWEGLTMLPAALSPDGEAHLLAVNEASPRVLGVFHPETLAPQAMVPVQPSYAVKLSQKQAADSQGGFTLAPLGLLKIPGLDSKKTRLQPEGLSFDAAGDLWVSAEGDLCMRQFVRD